MANDRAIRLGPVLNKAFVIAGPASAVGKTTVTLSVIAALRKRGLTVQPFKCGPDFIDGGHHAKVCGRPSRNLDGWMLSADANRQIFSRGARGAEICVVEGMMGLFDGVDSKSEAGRTAEIAKWLGLPVILVVDASSIGRSAAALVHGFENFDASLRLVGVIFNGVGGPAHYQLLKDALATSTNAVPLGYLPRDERIHIPERYLGLFTAGENVLPASVLSLLAELGETNIDLDKLLECTTSISAEPSEGQDAPRAVHSIRLGVARDKAFRSEEHTSELQSRVDLVCRLLLEKKSGRSRAQPTRTRAGRRRLRLRGPRTSRRRMRRGSRRHRSGHRPTPHVIDDRRPLLGHESP